MMDNWEEYLAQAQEDLASRRTLKRLTRLSLEYETPHDVPPRIFDEIAGIDRSPKASPRALARMRRIFDRLPDRQLSVKYAS